MVGKCCSNNPKVVKKASLNTKGMLATRFSRCGNRCPRVMFNSVYPYTWVQPLQEESSTRIARLRRSVAECVIDVTNAGNIECADPETDKCRRIRRAGSRLMPLTPYHKTAGPTSYQEYNKGGLMKKECLFQYVVKENDPRAHFPMEVNGGGCTRSVQTVPEAIAVGLLPANHINSA